MRSSLLICALSLLVALSVRAQTSLKPTTLEYRQLKIRVLLGEPVESESIHGRAFDQTREGLMWKSEVGCCIYNVMMIDIRGEGDNEQIPPQESQEAFSHMTNEISRRYGLEASESRKGAVGDYPSRTVLMTGKAEFVLLRLVMVRTTVVSLVWAIDEEHATQEEIQNEFVPKGFEFLESIAIL